MSAASDRKETGFCLAIVRSRLAIGIGYASDGYRHIAKHPVTPAPTSHVPTAPHSDPQRLSPHSILRTPDSHSPTSPAPAQHLVFSLFDRISLSESRDEWVNRHKSMRNCHLAGLHWSGRAVWLYQMTRSSESTNLSATAGFAMLFHDWFLGDWDSSFDGARATRDTFPIELGNVL